MKFNWRHHLFCLGLAAFLTGIPQAIADTTPSSQEGITDHEIILGSCAPLSGPQKTRGTLVVEGGRAYFKHINDLGGVNGRKITLVSCDDHYNENNGAIGCFDNCLKGKAFLGTLFLGSSSASKYVTMSDLSHIPIVGLAAGGDFIVHPVHRCVFQLRACDLDEAAAQIDAVWNKLGLRRIALVYQDDFYGVTCRKGVIAALKNHGASLVAEASYPRMSTDLSPFAPLIKSSNPDAVIIAGAGKAVPLIVKNKAQFGKNPLMVTFSSSTDWLLDGAGEAGNGTLISQVLPLPEKNLPAVQLFKKIWSKQHQTPPTVSAFEGFVIAMTVVEGLKRAGRDLTREGFVKAMESMNGVDIGLGKNFELKFSAENHDGFNGHVYMSLLNNDRVDSLPDWDKLKQTISNK